MSLNATASAAKGIARRLVIRNGIAASRLTTGPRTAIAAGQQPRRMLQSQQIFFTTNGYNHNDPQGMHVKPHQPTKGNKDKNTKDSLPKSSPRGTSTFQEDGILTGGGHQTPNPAGLPRTAERPFSAMAEPLMDIESREANTQKSPQDFQETSKQEYAASAAPEMDIQDESDLLELAKKEAETARANPNLSYETHAADRVAALHSDRDLHHNLEKEHDPSGLKDKHAVTNDKAEETAEDPQTMVAKKSS